MATKLHNLSEYDAAAMPDKNRVAKQRYAIAVADWNAEITYALLQGAVDALKENGVQEKNITVKHVPGTFELTFAAKVLQNKREFAAIIVLGCVIQGDTPHFDYVCQGVTLGITQLNAKTYDGGLLNEYPAPVIFGVLTTNTLQQSKDRAGGALGNKGVECAIAAIKMANLF
ncbi:MAG: 6,7-dimethyl-8-ribityllumazine synthase [Prevotellaceae bacterium]|jgi:6,7-dimethyl-8-ribityllumazine synthase|nr:6,7-dimethyl-8-ribityllumazine synthase [Prevotellaceae bacterium]